MDDKVSVSSALQPHGGAKLSTRLKHCWGKGGNVTSAGWQVTPCNLIWHVSSRSSEAASYKLLYSVYLYFLLLRG